MLSISAFNMAACIGTANAVYKTGKKYNLLRFYFMSDGL